LESWLFAFAGTMFSLGILWMYWTKLARSLLERFGNDAVCPTIVEELLVCSRYIRLKGHVTGDTAVSSTSLVSSVARTCLPAQAISQVSQAKRAL
jgi:hypothetical protein